MNHSALKTTLYMLGFLLLFYTLTFLIANWVFVKQFLFSANLPEDATLQWWKPAREMIFAAALAAAYSILLEYIKKHQKQS